MDPLTQGDLLKIIKDLQQRIALLESRVITSLSLKKGTLIIPQGTADPTSPTGGQVYYNTATGKFRKYDTVAGAWKNFEVT